MVVGCPKRLHRCILPDSYHIEITQVTGSGPFQIKAIDAHECRRDIIAAIGGQRIIPRRRNFNAHSFLQANAAYIGAPLYCNSEQRHNLFLLKIYLNFCTSTNSF